MSASGLTFLRRAGERFRSSIYIVSPFFYKTSVFGFSVTMPLPRKVADVMKEQI